MTARVLFDFHYPRGIDNDPLLEPYQVLSIQDQMLQLADGRIVVMDSASARLAELIKSSGGRVDLESGQDGKGVSIFVKSRFAQCGDPFANVRWLFPPYRIPLFPVDYPLNFRDRIGDGQMVANQESS